MKKTFLSLLGFTLIASASFGGVANVLVNPGGVGYPTLKAAFDAINAGAHTGAITIAVQLDTTEAAVVAAPSIVLNASGAGAASYTSIVISPSGGAARTISGAATAGFPLIDFSGADNVTIDGLNTDGNSLTISNTTASATSGTSTIRFIGGATNNTITSATILGSFGASVATNGGNVFFSTDAVTANGNDNNTVSNCNIGPAGASLPTKGIYSNGSTSTAAINNSGIVINNNNIADYFGATVTSGGVYIAGGSTDINVTNNRFYQTATRTQTTGAQHSAIWIANTSGNNFLISGNTIGFAAANGTGTYNFVAVSSSSVLVPIFLNVGTTTATSVQGNTVAGIAMSGAGAGTSSSAAFRAIYVSGGLATIGNVTGNTIGSQSATGSITYTSTSTSASDVIGIFNFGSSNFTTNNNTVGGITASNSSTGAANIYPIRCFTGSSVTWTCNNNVIGGTVANSINSTSTATGTIVQGILNSAPIGTFTGNTIRNMTVAGGTGTTTGSSMAGIVINATNANHTLSQNAIFNLSNTNATAATVVTGIQYHSSTGTNLVERNLIYGLTSATTSTAAEINGIRVGAGTTTYRNNMIAIGAGVANAIGTGTTNGISGINEPLVGTDNFFHNSVYIGGSPTAGVGSSFAFNSTQATNTRSFRDNVFFNARSNSGATGKNYAVRVGGTTANPTGLTINSNVYFANGTGAVFGFFNSLDVANLAAWKAAVGQDAGSFEGNPQYLDPTNATPDLHINPAVTTVIEGNGVDVGVINDFDGETRSGLTPVDIGADAGNFLGIDLSAPGISYTPLPNTNLLSNPILPVTITDVTGVATGGLAPRIYFNKNAGAYSSTAASLSSGTVQNGVWNCTIDYSLLGGVAVTDVIRYFVVAQDTLGNLAANPSAGFTGTDVNTVTTPPTTPNSYTIVASLSGTFTVGAGGNYPSLTGLGGAITALNNSVITGPVVFNLIENATGPQAAETYPITINANPGSSATNTVTIKPSAANATMTGSSTGALIVLNGADYVTIDGSSNGTASRDLMITNTNTGTTSAVIWLQSSGADGATNNTVKSVNLVGTTTTAVPGTLIGVGSGSSTISIASTGTGNDNNTFQNNNITKTSYGIYSGGASAANKNTATVITQNVMNAASPNNITTGGILVNFDDGAQITQNDISVLKHDGTAGTTATAFGIAAGVVPSNTVTTFTGNDVTNASIRGNKINGVTQLHATGYSALGIVVNTVTFGTTQISNNMISGVVAASTASDFSSGIVAGGGAGSVTQIYYNSVAMSGSRNAATFPSYGLAIGGSNPTVDVRNNIFFNNQTSTSTGKMYAIGTISSTFTNMTSNYNDFFVAGISGFVGQTGGLGTSGTDRATLANWQSTTGTDSNSISTNPVFVTITDLHLSSSSSPAANAGTLGTGITTDFDGNARSATKPDIGADEVASNKLADLVPGMGSLTPGFDPDIDMYNVSVSSGATSITFTPTVLDTNATVTVDGNSVTSGNPSPAIPLSVGNNNILVVVTPEAGPYPAAPTAGTPKTYTVVVNRAAPTYMVTYDGNGNTGGTAPIDGNAYLAGATVTVLSPGSLLRTNYTFANWNTAANGSGTSYNPADTFTMPAMGVTLYAQWAINTYTLTYTAGANGTIVGTSPQTVNHGGNGTLVTATPNTGYHFVSWSDGYPTAARTDMNVTADITSTATFAINTYTLTYTAGANGTIVGTSPQMVNHGANGTLVTATPDTGYHFVSWSDGYPTAARTDMNVTADITATATFAINTYTLAYTAGANGTIVGTSPQMVNHGANGTLVTATPDTGYHFVSWSDGYPTAARTDMNVTADITATATFAINIYTLTYTAGANGTIVGTSPQMVNHGANGTLVTATPNTGYHFVSWSDGYPTAARTDMNVTADITATATFAINTYTLTYTAGANGTIVGTSPQTVNHGANGTLVTATPNTGYHFVSWSDGYPTAARTDMNVTADITATATFAINTYTLTYTAGPNGSISGTSPQMVNHGANGTAVTAVPNAGYQFVNWSDNSTANPRTDMNVTANVNVTANFALLNTYAVTYDGNTNTGGMAPVDPNSPYNAGATVTVLGPGSLVRTGYAFSGWNTAANGSGTSYAPAATFTMPANNVTLYAQWTINTYTLTYTAGANGSISGTSPQMVNYGASGTAVTAVPNAGYLFVNWSDASVANPRTDTNVTANISVTANFAVSCVPPNLVYVNASWVGTTPGTDPDGAGPATNFGCDSFATIQEGVNGVAVPGTVHVYGGTYDEDLALNKADLSLIGEGASTTNVRGPIGGPGSTMQVTQSNVTIAGFTITRLGNNTTDWNNPGLNTAGIAIQGLGITGTQIHDNVLTGNRTGIDVNNSTGHTIRNNVIDFNRTGMIFRNTTDELTVVENFITNNWTVGVLFLDGSGGTNVPPQRALHSGFNNNNLSANWYGQIADRQTGGSLPAPGNNPKNFRGDWFGTTTPVITTNNTTEPGYAAQIPVAYGGTATAPGGQPDIAGPASPNFQIDPLLQSGTDTNVETTPGRGTNGFQGVANTIVVSPLDQHGWAFFDDFPGTGTGSGGFAYGPGTPPLGVGSAYLTVDSQGRYALGTAAYVGTYLSDITTLKYDSYQNNNANTAVAASLQFDVDYDLNDGSNTYQGRLVFEPYQSGTVQQNVWQQWDVLAGNWYGTRATVIVGGISIPNPCTQSNPCTTAQVLANYPNLGVRNAPNSPLLFKVGGPWAPGFNGNVDDLNIQVKQANVVYDFEPGPTYTVTYNGNGNTSGTAPVDGNAYQQGDTVTVLNQGSLVQTGYAFANWNTAANGSGTSYNPAATFAMPANNVSLFAQWTINTYTLTYTAGANGSISGTSPQMVNYGASGTAVTAVPNTGYHFVNWSDASTDNPRTDMNVTADISVTANFAINTYTLTYTAGANGTIVGTSPQMVNHGANGTLVTATPNTGYHFVSWSDGYPTAARTDMNVTADITATATFAINTYTLTYTAGANGTIVGTSPQMVNHGANGAAVTAVPDSGYQFVNWSDSSTQNPRTDNNVMGNISVTANFALIPASNVTVNPGAASYATLKDAFDAINAGTHTGAVSVSIVGDTTETASAVLNASGTGSASYTSVDIAPNGARIVSGAIAAGSPLIDLDGADNVTINGGSVDGIGGSLTLANTTVSATAGTSTIRFINGAANNMVKNCTIRGSSTGAVTVATGNVLFSTSAAGGNNSNVIMTNNIGPAGTDLPTKGVMALGSTSPNNNTGNMISGNNIYDFFSATIGVAGVSIQANNHDWTISNNRIYQTAARTFTGTVLRYAGLTLNPGTAGAMTVTGNVIGFGAADGTGTTTISGLTNTFRGIDAPNVSTATATSIQGNTISGINQTTASTGTGTSTGFVAMMLGTTGGRFDVGTVTANNIGSLNGSSTIVINSSAGTGTVNGIYDFSVSANNISNNNIGSITIQGTGTTNGFRGILVNTSSTQLATINNNTIANITDTLVGSYAMYAIQVSLPPTSMTGNVIRNMTGNANGAVVVMSGIAMSSGTATAASTISQNTIHSLSNTVTGGAAGAVYAVDLALANQANVIERNLVHSINVNSTFTTYQLWGLVMRGQGSATFKNNMIRLGIDAAGNSITTGFSIIGIREIAGATCSFYNNTVYIGGTGVVSASNTYAFNSNVVTNVRNYMDNIFWNARSNGTGVIANVAIAVGGTAPNPAGLISDYNDLFASGMGGAVGVFNALIVPTLNDWRTATGQDLNSISADPVLVNPTGDAAMVNLHLDCGSAALEVGTPIGSVTNDFDGDPRSATTPDIGADEVNFVAPAALSAVSRKTHGAAGDFDIALPGVESRSGGVNGEHQLVVTFGTVVNVGSVSVTSGVGSVVNATGNGTNTITVNLTGVANAQYVTVKLGCTDDGVNIGDISVTMGVLLGDASGDGTVQAGDTIIVRDLAGTITTQPTAPADVNVDGVINVSDTIIVRNASGSALPPSAPDRAVEAPVPSKLPTLPGSILVVPAVAELEAVAESNK